MSIYSHLDKFVIPLHITITASDFMQYKFYKCSPARDLLFF